MASGTQGSSIVLTAGEPAGIGPELCLALADTEWAEKLVVVADADMLAERADTLGWSINFIKYDGGKTARRGTLSILNQPLASNAKCGELDTANAGSLLDGIRRAVDGCRTGEFSGLVTAPLQKSVINDSGIAFTGHTEFLAELTGAPNPVMLLVADQLRVALASTHLPLRDVADFLTTDRIIEVLQIMHGDLQRKFQITNPAIIVCGLNPHAGEGGYLGTEDQEVIAPAIEQCIAAGMNVRGPLPADTAFTPAAGKADAILAMYHDQGLPVLKYAGFGHAVNVTLGLPIVRTSVDHGTALDIAGKGVADVGSLLAAVRLAATLAA
ncbi:MAG: 4-hydroxythreonine-4-phosphate dehydrogenase PdxA [Woeseiaceae bacterium]